MFSMPRKSKDQLEKESIILYIIYGMILLLMSLITVLYPYSGILGDILAGCFRFVFGDIYYLIIAYLIVLSLFMIFAQRTFNISLRYHIGMLLIFIGIILIFAIPEDHSVVGFDVLKSFNSKALDVFKDNLNADGGIIGAFIYSCISGVTKFVGSIIFIVIDFLGAVALIIDVKKIKELTNKLKKEDKQEISQSYKQPTLATERKRFHFSLGKFTEKKEKENNEVEIREYVPEDIQEPENIQETIQTKAFESIMDENQPYNMYPNYQLPRLSLLDVPQVNRSTANNSAAKSKGDKLVDILKQFDIDCWLQDIQIGPSVTRFELGVDPRTRLNKITSLQDNIAMGLAAKKVTIEAPIPGKNAVGIEIENIERNDVRLKDLLSKVPKDKENAKLLVALGKNLAGENEYGEINKMPHLLVGGSTGSGKSVCMNTIIASILFRCRPNEVKLLLIDPKKVEFNQYEGIPHLIAPVISDTNLASKALNTVVQIMDYRYQVFHNKAVRDIDEYNSKCVNDTDFKYMYRLIVVIDELADLMVMHGKEVEGLIQRITQLARASGIHLIVATQRPSTDVITGTIKSNIPSRISFAVASAIDSRIILDSAGAENLLGKGDMLYQPMGESLMKRIQGVYVSDDEIKKVVEFTKSQGKPSYEDAFLVSETLDSEDANMNIDDPMFEECKKYIAQTQKASTSLLQRRFAIGYNRAARIIDALELEGSIGPQQGSKPREVYITSDDLD